MRIDTTDAALKDIIESGGSDEELMRSACEIRSSIYGSDVFVRGLIEISSFCRNDCFYCGIRRSNSRAERYRLSKEQILECCSRGYGYGMRTFVLQGGEDPGMADRDICEIIYDIKERFQDSAVTLSLGEKSRKVCKEYFDAGADRYLLRHETADEDHYRMLHPAGMDSEKRKRCLYDLKETGYQVGAGFMVGSPYQRTEHLISDIRFMQDLDPDMIGIGPFISHRDTPFRDFPDGDLTLTLRMLAILRHIFPEALIPSTTALATLDSRGRMLGFAAGANVVMPNLSPLSVRGKYELYDDKACTGGESAEHLDILEKELKEQGLHIKTDRGDRRRRR